MLLDHNLHSISCSRSITGCVQSSVSRSDSNQTQSSDVAQLDTTHRTRLNAIMTKTTAKMPDDHPINVTYTSTPTSLRHLPYILSSLNSQLPLRNFHWKSATKPSVRTVQQCDVRLHKLVDVQTREQGFKLPRNVETGSLVEGSLVHMCFVECEASRAYDSGVLGR